MQNIIDKFSKNKTQNEKYNINMEIENAQIKKANLLLDIGIMTYEKIRNNRKEKEKKKRKPALVQNQPSRHRSKRSWKCSGN